MIRILFLITDFDRGGAERMMYELVRRLDRERFAPQVACVGGEGHYSDLYRALGVPVHHLGLRTPHGPGAVWFPIAFVACVRRLRRLLETERIDALQSFLFHANMVGRLAARGMDRALVIGGVRTAEPRRSHMRFDRWTFGMTRGEVCNSEAVRQFQARYAGVPRGRLFVIPNGIDPAEFPLPAAPFGLGSKGAAEERTAAREALGLPAEAPVLASVGRLCTAKALPVLLDALARVRADVHLALAGDGPLREDLAEWITERGLTERVACLGWLDDPRRLYAAADAFVLSSHTEGMPGVVLEAMAAGLPVVTTNAPGCSELVIEGDTGRIVPCGDPAALAGAIEATVSDPDAAAEMGARARARALDEFTLDAMARAYETLYEELLAEHHPPRAT